MHQHDGITNSRHVAKRRFNFSEFDPGAPNFDLVIDTANELQLPIWKGAVNV